MRIPLPVFIGFFCICALGTILGVVYSLRHRMAWLYGTKYQEIKEEFEMEMRGGYLDLQKFELEEQEEGEITRNDSSDTDSESLRGR